MLLVGIAAGMFRKGRHKDFPVFFAYLLFEVVQFCVLFVMDNLDSVSAMTYARADLVGRIGSIAIRFGVIQELFEAPMAHCLTLRRAMSRLLNGAALFLALLASAFMASLYFRDFGEVLFPAYVPSQTLNTVQCGLLALIFLWHRILGLRMQNLVFGIALGMGLVSGFEPLLNALRITPQGNSHLADFAGMAVYHVSALVWLYFTWAREDVRSEQDAAVPWGEVYRWKVELGRLLHP